MVNSDFWATSAQTMPVLALAIVVEARTIVGRWSKDWPYITKAIQVATWSVPLLIYTFAIPACFRALSGVPVSNKWPSVISLGISLGIAVLVVTPLFEILLRSNTRIITHLLYLWVVRGFPLKTRLRLRRTERVRRRLAQAEVELDALNKSLEEKLRAHGAHLPIELQDEATQAREMFAVRRRIIESCREELDSIDESIRKRIEHQRNIYARVEAVVDRLDTQLAAPSSLSSSVDGGEKGSFNLKSEGNAPTG